MTVGGDAHGNALAVFVVQPMSDDGPNQQHVSFVRLPSGAGEWSAPLAISSVGPNDRASLDVGANGNAIALWQTDDATYALALALAEKLGKEAGFYQDPYSDLGRLSLELWRAGPLVVDPGTHVVEVARPGYRTERLDVEAVSGEEVWLEVELEPTGR